MKNLKKYITRINLQLLLIFLLPTIATAQGGWQWATNYGGDRNPPYETVKSLQTDQWGNIYIAGTITDIYQRDSAGNVLYDSNFFPLLHNYGKEDIWVAKYSPTGKSLWHEYAGSGNPDVIYASITDKIGNTFIAGRLSYNSFRLPHTFNKKRISNDSLTTFIAKLDSSGKLLWHKPFGFDSINNIRLTMANIGVSINKYNQLVFFINSDSRKLIFNVDTIDEGWHAVKLDLNGSFIQSKRLPFKDYQNSPSNLKTNIDANGNYYFHGSFQRDTLFLLNDTIVRDGQNVANGIVLAIDSNAHYKWSFVSNNSYDPITSGKVLGDTIFTSINVTSFQVDTVSFGSHKYKTNTKTTQESVLLMLNSNNGNVIGLKHNSGTQSQYSVSYSVAANKDFMAIGGKFDKKMTFSGTTNYMESVSKSSGFTNSDNYFALFDRQGNFICEDFLYTFGSVDGIQQITFVDSTIYVAGFFSDTLYVNGDTLIAAGGNDIFLARYDLPCGKGIPVGIKNKYIPAENGVLVYPNPAAEFTNLIGKPISNTAQLLDIKGRVVKSFSLDVNLIQQQIPLDEIEPGIYFLTIVGNKEKQVLKIVKK
ncbi:T9SS type A sorting domain-containing protein [Acidiluteibacter ferrifornacis]|uniref:T9SS type A sorting domain-containing protein n=1 Tax=Acidiluteibacter ferrifornacis TaxID=2692424 RepID=A0A6N9NPG6_9FLAO|nr:T9SS type A sorting domain-containing protein [Acidiluteibacter ferrifornacis]NBG67180.1 T9SS type A sorting domain-containing protein [Acidiluteibacter ferrifornacis]